MKAVHFGAGHIGRGFIGALLQQAGYEVVFVDVNDPLIHELNAQKAYVVKLAGTNECLTIDGVRGLNSRTNAADVISEVASSDLVTTAVGLSALKFVADPIAKGLQRRSSTAQPLNVIACENAIGASAILREYVQSLFTEAEWGLIAERTGFPDAAVDRIVPDQVQSNLLTVTVERFYEWVVDETAIKGPKPVINGITYVKDLVPYIERKLFTVNTGHAMIAYLGFQQGFKTIQTAINDQGIASLVRQALHETQTLLVAKYGFSEDEHQAYVEKVMKRFNNPALSDEVTRVGRNPIRKLGRNDRLVKPARELLEYGYEPEALVEGIAAALSFDVKEDEESARLQAMISKNGVEETIAKVTGLKRDDALMKRILDRV